MFVFFLFSLKCMTDITGKNLHKTTNCCFQILVVKCDVLKDDNLELLVDKTLATFGQIDALVNID